MNYNSVKEIIDDIECNVEVEKITYENYNIWSLIKYHLYFGLLKFSESSNEKNAINSSNYNCGKLSVLTKVKNHFINLVQLCFNFIKHKRELSRYRFQVKKHDALLIDVVDFLYEDRVDGKEYSRYISPYLENLIANYSVTLLNTISNERTNSKLITPYFFDTRYYFRYTGIRNHYLGKFSKKNQFENYNLLESYISDKTFKQVIDKNALDNELKKIVLYEKLWIEILLSVKPKLVFLSCHYGSVSHSGMLSATKKLNIKSVEIQHGLSLGPMYLGWYKTPIDKGYDFLPDYYWSWSLADVEVLKNSRRDSKIFIPLLGGNLWFTKNLNQDIMNENNLKLDDIITDFKPSKIILVTLQHSIPLSDILIEAISKSQKNWLWLIRFHPRDFLDPKYRSNYINALCGFNNVEYVYSTSANLYPMLKKTHIHITHHSAISVESISFKIPSILLGNKFQNVFTKYIETGNFYVADTSDEILNFIKRGIYIKEETFDYFKLHSDETSLSEIESLFK